MISSFTEIKFWNKNSSVGDFLITNCLDNYFRSQSSRLKCGHINNQIQFNSSPDQQSIEKILYKKIQGIRQYPCSQSVLKQQIKFINKGRNHSTCKTLEQVFNFYLEYKQNSKQLNKALNEGKINQQIIKPFLKVYSAMKDGQYELVQSTKQYKMKKQFHIIFDSILKQNKKLFQNSQSSSDTILENYFKDSRLKIKPNVLKQADKIQLAIEEKGKKTQHQKSQHEKVKFQCGNKCILMTQKQNQDQNQTILPLNKKVPLSTTKVSVKKLKFQQISQQYNDDSELCRQLDLLISDTNKILKPNEDS